MQPQPVHLCTADQKKRVLDESQAAKDQLEGGCQRKSRVLFFFFVVHTHRCGSSSINANFCDAISSCFTLGEEEMHHQRNEMPLLRGIIELNVDIHEIRGVSCCDEIIIETALIGPKLQRRGEGEERKSCC